MPKTVNKTEETLLLLLQSATKAEENGHRLIGRAEGLRDTVKFFRDNGLTIVGPAPEEPKPESK